ALGYPAALLERRVEARPALVDCTPRAQRDLAAVGLALADDLADLRERIAEHVMQQEHRALERGEALEQHEERKRQRVAELGMVGRAGAGVDDQWLGQPLADVLLAPHARRAQVVD